MGESSEERLQGELILLEKYGFGFEDTVGVEVRARIPSFNWKSSTHTV